MSQLSAKIEKVSAIVGIGGKVLTIVLGLAAFVFGCIAIFIAETRKTFTLLKDIEQETNSLFSRHSGPPWWKEQEDLFIAGILIAFLACVANLVFTIVVKDPLDKACDGFMQFLTALVVIFCAFLLCTSAITTDNVSYLYLKSDVRFLSPKPGGLLGGIGGEKNNNAISIPNSTRYKDSDREKFMKKLDNKFFLKLIAVAIALINGIVLLSLSLIICILPQRKKKSVSPMFSPQPMMMEPPPMMMGSPPMEGQPQGISPTSAPGNVSQNENTNLLPAEVPGARENQPRLSTASQSAKK